MPEPISDVEPLTSQHDVTDFDCGVPVFNDWLRKHALQSQRSDGVRVFVLHRSGRVVGYYALTFGSVARAEAPPRHSAGLGQYGGIPVIILARLAVDAGEQGRNLGTALFRDALLRAAGASEIAGLRAMLIHVYDDSVRSFYARFNLLEESPTNPLHLFLLMKDLRRMIAD